MDEVLIAHPKSLTAELYRSADGVMAAVVPDPDGLLTLQSIPVRVGHAEAEGHPAGVLRVATPDGMAHDIDPGPGPTPPERRQ